MQPIFCMRQNFLKNRCKRWYIGCNVVLFVSDQPEKTTICRGRVHLQLFFAFLRKFLKKAAPLQIMLQKSNIRTGHPKNSKKWSKNEQKMSKKWSKNRWKMDRRIPLCWYRCFSTIFGVFLVVFWSKIDDIGISVVHGRGGVPPLGVRNGLWGGYPPLGGPVAGSYGARNGVYGGGTPP